MATFPDFTVTGPAKQAVVTASIQQKEKNNRFINIWFNN
jgi:hypothetical protein